MSSKKAQVDERAVFDTDEVITRKLEARLSGADAVKAKLRSGWRNDAEVLQQYFDGVYANWKLYKGPRTQKQVFKLQSIYKQATIGDCNLPPPDNLKTVAGEKWVSWMGFKGMDQTMAKRRFITFVAEIDPIIIDVMPDEKPPAGFPMDRQGRPICAKCNTFVGCDRDILNDKNMSIRRMLFEEEEYHEPHMLREWIKNSIATQHCVWGRHTAITEYQAKAFEPWFNRPENRGFLAYDSSNVMLIVRELVKHYYDIAWDIMNHKDEYPDATTYNDNAGKALKLQEMFEQFSGEKFLYEAYCTKFNDPHCNMKRLANGGTNHKHEVTLDPPTYADQDSYEEAIELREQCKRLGLSITTGPVKSVQERCDIYRNRISDNFKAIEVAAAATKRLELRADIHLKEKNMVFRLSTDMISRQCWDACQAGLPEKVVVLIRRGCDPNEESPRGLTPLLCCIINNSPTEMFEELFLKGCNVNYINKFGMTPLILSVRLRNTKMIHLLMKNGASATMSGGRKGSGNCAMHYCALHGCEEEAKILYDYIKEGLGDAMRTVRLLDAPNVNGETPLMVASVSRNGLFCKVLSGLGANPNLRNKAGRTAAFLARHSGWTEIAEWLEKKSGSGVSKVETYGDMQFDRTLRYGIIKTKDNVLEFMKVYLNLIQDKLAYKHLGCPSKCQLDVFQRGERALVEQRVTVNNHQLYIQCRDEENNVVEHPPEIRQKLDRLQELVHAILTDLRAGIVNPNIETEPKPLGWTPLMCAAIIQDVRSIKLMIREGADPNYPNSVGTTPLMLSCQLHNIHSIFEMLIMGGDVSAVDNEGYNAMAYANSLPAPISIEKSFTNFALDGDNEAPRRLSAADLLKAAKECDIINRRTSLEIGLLKKVLDENDAQTSQEAIDNHFRFIRLLEKYGLTRIDTEKQVRKAAESTDWRTEAIEFEKKYAALDEAETKSEEAERLRYEAYVAKKEKEAEADREDNDGNGMTMRCPICTLNVPGACTHFFKLATLKRMLERNKNKGPQRKKGQLVSRKVMLEDKRQRILDETHIGDRKTDRSVTFANAFRPQEIQMDKHAKLLLSQGDDFYDDRPDESGALIAGSLAITQYGETKAESGADASNQLVLLPALLNTDTNTADVRNAAVVVFDSRPGVVLSNPSTASDFDPYSTALVPDDMDYIPIPIDLNAKPTRSCLPKGPRKKKSVRFDEVIDDQGEGGANSTTKSRPSTANNNNAASATVSNALVAFGGSAQPQPMHASNSINSLASSFNSESADNEIIGSGSLEIDVSVHSKKVDKGAVEVAVSSGSENEAEKLAPCPIPYNERRIFMFTKDGLDRGGLQEGMVDVNNFKAIARASSPGASKGGRSPPRTPPGGLSSSGIPSPPRSAPKTVDLPTNAAQHRPLPDISICGWLFCGMSSLDGGRPPVEGISMPLNVWGALLEHIRRNFVSNMTNTMNLDCMLDMVARKPKAPRCSVCFIGFVRSKARLESFKTSDIYNNDAEGNNSLPFDDTLCLTCLIRRDIYEKAKLVLPRNVRKTMRPWPFKRRGRKDEVYDPEMEQYQAKVEAELINNEELPPDQAKLLQFQLNMIDKSASVSAKLFELEAFGDSSILSIEDDAASISSSSQSISNMSKESSGNKSKASIKTSSTQSTDPGTDEKFYGPREMTLIPFLIAKGLYEDAERMIRSVLAQPGVNEGEGLPILLKLLGFSAEMYKFMGLWPLAVGIYLDSVEICAQLMGMDNILTHACVGNVTSSFRKMGCDNLAKQYLAALMMKLNTGGRLATNEGLLSDLQINDSRWNSERKAREEYWLELFRECAPARGIERRAFNSYGIGGMRRIVTSSEGFAIASKIAFFDFCEYVDDKLQVVGEGKALRKKTGNKFTDKKLFGEHKVCAQVINYAARLRVVDDGEIQRHIIQQLLQKFLSVNLKTRVSKIFQDITDPAYLNYVNQFLQTGLPFEVQAFDSILKYAIKMLSKPFKEFFFGPYGFLIRDNILELSSEAFYCVVTKIQSLWRAKMAKRRILEMKNPMKKFGSGHIKLMAKAKGKPTAR